MARNTNCEKRLRSFRATFGGGNNFDAGVPCFGQRGNDDGNYAGDGNTFAADELRNQLADNKYFGGGNFNEHSHAKTKNGVVQLNFFTIQLKNYGGVLE